MRVLFTTLFLFVIATLPSTMVAQDIIVMKDGSLVKSKVYEITPSEIKYKKFSNPQGPFYTIERSRVLAVNYENGEKDVFSDAADKQKDVQANTSSRYDEALPDVNNASVIAQYNQPLTFKGKVSRKKAKSFVCKYGITSGSVLSNKDVEIRIELVHIGNCCQYGINVRNKTEKVIYIDLGNTFRVEQNGKSFIYYDASKQISVTHGNASGGSLGLGSVANVLGIGGVVGTLANGVSVGGGNQHSVSTAYSPQRIIAIAPHGTNYLSMHKEVEVKPETALTNRKIEYLSHCECFSKNISLLENISIKSGTLHKGETHIFSESESPAKREYLITYSTEETFNSYSTIKFGLYVQQVYGEDFFYWFSWAEGDLKKKDDVEKNIKKRLPDYNSFSILGGTTWLTNE